MLPGVQLRRQRALRGGSATPLRTPLLRQTAMRLCTLSSSRPERLSTEYRQLATLHHPEQESRLFCFGRKKLTLEQVKTSLCRARCHRKIYLLSRSNVSDHQIDQHIETDPLYIHLNKQIRWIEHILWHRSDKNSSGLSWRQCIDQIERDTDVLGAMIQIELHLDDDRQLHKQDAYQELRTRILDAAEGKVVEETGISAIQSDLCSYVVRRFHL